MNGNATLRLTARERTELFGEGIITLVLLLMLNLSLIVLGEELIANNPGFQFGIHTINHSIWFSDGQPPRHPNLWSFILDWKHLLTFLMLVFDTGIVYWRLIRRYHLIQLRHIISEIHYIAQGHFDHRIQFKVKGENQKVVESVNSLVDSVIDSMNEERQIERSKDDMITNVSHDIRTPLTSIIGYLGLLESNQSISPQDQKKYVNIAYMKAKQMKSLADDLFEYTKDRQPSAPMAIQSINLDQMMAQLAASFEYDAEKVKMKISSECHPENLKIDGDPDKLARVFNNLISNSLKYGNDGKNIYLNAQQLNDKEVVVKVSNDGDKIPQSAINQIFDRFYRVETSRNKETGGTGLGLAIVQGIVSNHNGYVDVSSDDHLTTFAVHLPIYHDQPLKKTGFKKLQSIK